MNAKEKAKELINNYIDIMPCLKHQTGNTIKYHAINCSVILCTEIIEGINKSDMTRSDIEKIIFWQDVKKEFELLKLNLNLLC